jgi:hypothetical protein
MKEVLVLIETKKQEFAQTPFIQFLQDKTIAPRQRLAFTPCFAPFVMGFGELNKYYWREENTNDPIQAIINQHTYEDDSHWIWFLEDIQKLGFDQPVNFSDSLKFVWGDETQLSRQTIYEIYRYTYRANPIHKLVVIESIEAIASLFFTATTQVVQEFKSNFLEDYKYFGMNHLSVESSHSKDCNQTQEYINNLHLSPEDYAEIVDLVDKVFDLFTNFFNQLIAFTKKGRSFKIKNYAKIKEYNKHEKTYLNRRNFDNSSLITRSETR